MTSKSLITTVAEGLDPIIENRLNTDIQSFDRIIIILIDGMNLNSMTGAGKDFSRKIKFEFIPMSTSFPSMTTVATTSLLTGSFPIAHGVVADSFYDFEEEKVTKVKPYLTQNAQQNLPKIIPITDYFLLSEFWDKDCVMGIITLGKANEKLSDREFIDFFFGEEFSIGGEFTKVNTNYKVYLETKNFISKNKEKKFYFLFVRFSIDHLAHLFGPASTETREEMQRLFGYLIDLSNDLRKKQEKALMFLVSDHGHKELDAGFLPISSLRKFLGPNYKYIATNQTLLSLYHDDLHVDHPDYNQAKMVRLIKKNSDFYYYSIRDDNWKILKKKIEDLEALILPVESYGIDNRVGDLVVHAENFYFAYHDIDYYKGSDFPNFKSSHGGLSKTETFISGLFWSSI